MQQGFFTDDNNHVSNNQTRSYNIALCMLYNICVNNSLWKLGIEIMLKCFVYFVMSITFVILPAGLNLFPCNPPEPYGNCNKQA
jgi:hypothetical protein